MKGPMSSLLQMAEERRSWSSLSAESALPLSVAVVLVPGAVFGATFRRDFVDCIVSRVVVETSEREREICSSWAIWNFGQQV